MSSQRSPSLFLAYTYESDDEDGEDEIGNTNTNYYYCDDDDDGDCCFRFCGESTHHDVETESGGESPVPVDETTALVKHALGGLPSAVLAKEHTSANTRRNSTNNILKVACLGTIAIGMSLSFIAVVFCGGQSCSCVLRRQGIVVGDSDAVLTTTDAHGHNFVVPVVSGTTNDGRRNTATIKVSSSTTTSYGEVWLIRHGEKDPLPDTGCDTHATTTTTTPSSSSSSSSLAADHPCGQQAESLRAMYELSARGWDRANHLSSLVRKGEWPLFSALFASKPATPEEAQNAYPDFARDAMGQSMVEREYQTLVPISEYLRNKTNNNSISTIRARFTKGEVKEAALEIAKTAVAAAAALGGNTQQQGTALSKTSGKSQASSRAVVLVSWDHCSLPTLVVNGFGCGDGDYIQQKDPLCYRCWSDDRFGDVLKLNVSLVTTTTTTLKTTKSTIAKATEDSIEKNEIAEVVSHDYDYWVSSTIFAMTGEAYPADDYYYTPSDNHQTNNTTNNGASTAPGKAASASSPTSIKKSTPCVHSYCTERPASKHLVRCSCWDSTSTLSALPFSDKNE